MAITFEQTPLRWENTGTEPSESLKENGYSAGMKPAANTFNYQINNTSACLTELQTEVSALDTALTTLNEQAIKEIKGNDTTIIPSSTGVINITPSGIGAAESTHNHSATQITSGTLPIARGGTNGTTKTAARTNLEVLKAHILYDNDAGNKGTVTLSDNADNYIFLDIIIWDFYVTRVYNRNKRSAGLTRMGGYGGNYVEWFTDAITISNNTITRNGATHGHMSSNGSFTLNTTDRISIRAVIGYKY